MGVTRVRVDSGNVRVRRSLFQILRQNVLASFSTVRPTGAAHANTAYFAFSREPTIYWYSYPDSGHSRNLRSNPTMAVTVFDSHQRWGRADRGVQLFGSGEEARGKEAEEAAQIYGARFPRYSAWRSRLERQEGTFPLRPYGFRPRRIVVFDEVALGGGKFWELATRPSQGFDSRLMRRRTGRQR